jgi:hypothetical protein
MLIGGGTVEGAAGYISLAAALPRLNDGRGAHRTAAVQRKADGAHLRQKRLHLTCHQKLDW